MGRWSPLQPPVMAALLADVNTPWWVAGGWALDLFLGFQTRSHDDLDVGILRRDVAAVIANLPGWELFEAKSQALYRLEDCESPRPAVNSLWCRPSNATSWSFELMLDEADGDTWVFRRLPTIRRSLAEGIRRTPDGIPYLAPEIQLLYKARHPRGKRIREISSASCSRLAPRACLATWSACFGRPGACLGNPPTLGVGNPARIVFEDLLLIFAGQEASI